MLSLPEQIMFIIFAGISLFLSYRTFSRLFTVIGKASGELQFTPFARRLGKAIGVLLTQRTVFRGRGLVSFIHALVAWAFILYFLVNIEDVLRGYIPGFHLFGQSSWQNYYALFVDIFSVAAILGVVFFLIRRFFLNDEQLSIDDKVMLVAEGRLAVQRDSLLVGLFIMAHVGFRFLGESFRLAAVGQPDAWQPLASAAAAFWSGIPVDSLIVLLHISWWLALGLILAFIPYFPYSKHAHLFMGPFNYFSKPTRKAPAALAPIDFENEEIEQFGAAKLFDLEKTALLDAYACIMCNRCQDACPAYVTGKELSPAAIEVNKRLYLNRNLSSLGNGTSEAQALMDFAISPAALWACTSCAACLDVCPVGNEPMRDILQIRRDRVLMESDFPSQLSGAFDGMEINGNPWNINDDRLAWAKADSRLEVPTVSENPDFDILYWVGCAGAFEERGQNIARSFARILNSAGVNFAVLGDGETCTGDSARRAGNEYLFAELATQNVETLNAAGVKKIVATCPHCLNTLKNEYSDFGGSYEVVHHTQLLAQLSAAGRLRLTGNAEEVAFHDPCYLGRHNQIFAAPRTSLSDSGVAVRELERHHADSFCCGAGGAQMWKEEEAGREAVRRERFREVIASGAKTLCTACPFCLTMLRDAGKELESEVQIHDIAEVIARRLG
jgi:Fe-S oxidoreductase